MYIDSAYLAKFYLNEPDSAPVRQAIAAAATRVTSAWAMAEVTCTFHRKVREGMIDGSHCSQLIDAFGEDVETEVWMLIPITQRILLRLTAALKSLPDRAFVRAGDALHLTTAMDTGEREIWSNDRHLLAAAPYFGLIGRSA
jgi:predicted nucleic acid-binding protein